MNVPEAIENLRNAMASEGVIPSKGVGEELFLFLSTMVPIINVDVLVVSPQREVLLSWRSDTHCGCVWHLHGGCIRFQESIESCLHRTAVTEFGSDVSIFKLMGIHEGIADKSNLKNPKERSHFISLLYQCELKDEVMLRNLDAKEIAGHLAWLADIPSNFLEIQWFYFDTLRTVMKEPKRRKDYGV